MNLVNKLFILFLVLIGFTNELVSKPSFYIDETKIIGTSLETNVDAYLGIPFAQPPVNDLRWKKTQSKIFKQTEFFATDFAPACMQGPRIVNWYRGVAVGFGGDPNYIDLPDISEDCLYLNMWVPNNIKNIDTKLPVLVYIHGGSNRAGWSFEPNYIGEKLAQKGTIVISVAYRLGVFGFYSHPELSVSNFALLDVIESLKWIQENISKVGGDPNNVTISGESAGATIIEHLIVSPLSKNLFNRAIHQSAGWSIADSEIINDDVHSKLSNQLTIELLNRSNFENNLNDMRKIDAIKLLKKAEEVYGTTGYYSVIDGYTITESVRKSFELGNINHVDLIIGSNKDEELMYLEKDYFLIDFYNERESYGFYTDIDNLNSIVMNIKNEKQKLNYLLTARNYTCPSFFIASSIKKYTKKNVWFYSFDKVRDGKKSKEMGAYHGAELPYIFNTHDNWLPTSQEDMKLTNLIQSFWLNFIKKGNPNSENSKWTSFKSENFNVLSFNEETLMKKSNSARVCKALNYL